MVDRYFVEILVPDRAALHRLQGQGLDLFRHSAGPHAAGLVIEGLLTLEEVGAVVSAGAQVLVREHASRRSRAHQETTTFEAWLAAQGED
jgi:hypothetical protein